MAWCWPQPVYTLAFSAFAIIMAAVHTEDSGRSPTEIIALNDLLQQCSAPLASPHMHIHLSVPLSLRLSLAVPFPKRCSSGGLRRSPANKELLHIVKGHHGPMIGHHRRPVCLQLFEVITTADDGVNISNEIASEERGANFRRSVGSGDRSSGCPTVRCKDPRTGWSLWWVGGHGRNRATREIGPSRNRAGNSTEL